MVLHLCVAGIEFQFTTDTISVTEETASPVVVCIQLLNSVLEENVIVTLQTVDGTAMGIAN